MATPITATVNVTMAPQVYLASLSPRRKQLLAQIGIRFEPLVVEIDEQWNEQETPEQYVRRMALEKAKAGQALIATGSVPTGSVLVLGADTALEIDDTVLGKPRDREHGLEMLERLSGRTHRVLSAVALVSDRVESCIQVSEVTFRSTTAAERCAYWDTREPVDKAGGYGIQGLGAVFISHLEGSYSSVMGLPLYETSQLLASFGIAVMDSE